LTVAEKKQTIYSNDRKKAREKGGRHYDEEQARCLKVGGGLKLLSRRFCGNSAEGGSEEQNLDISSKGGLFQGGRAEHSGGYSTVLRGKNKRYVKVGCRKGGTQEGL